MDLLDKLDKEQKIEAKQNKVSSKVLEGIVKCYEISLDKMDIYLQESYNLCVGTIKKFNLNYDADDISQFSIALANFQNHDEFCNGTGLFLSALANICKENDFVIYTNHLQRQIDFMFYQNVKNITLNGPVGRYAGRFMVAGFASVNGNANVFLGGGMQGGKITVNGNIGFGMGYLMHKGAILEINGDYDTIAASCAGKIYHNGILIFEDNHPINDCFENAIFEDSPFMYKKK